MDRLTDEDQRMLWPDEIWPQDIGALSIFPASRADPPTQTFIEQASAAHLDRDV